MKTGVVRGRNLALFVVFLLSILTQVAAVSAKSGHMLLLAVKETPEGLEGSTADLYLDIRPGSGKVYLDTLPLTKYDTQLSTRFAQQVACNFLSINCNNLDFFYTIRSDSAIVGGPSAGAATTILTISILDGTPIDEHVVITGTIDSGGMIGIVDGIKEKIEAAADAGATKVLFSSLVVASQADEPTFNGTLRDCNTTECPEDIDLLLHGKNLGVTVIPVTTLYDAMYEFTGKRYSQPAGDIVVPKDYLATMNMLATMLCNKSHEYDKAIARYTESNDTLDDETEDLLEIADNLTMRAEQSLEAGNPYSAASYCFGSNTYKSTVYLQLQNLSEEELSEKWLILERTIDEFDEKVKSRELRTLQDLQAYIIVKERIDESRNLAKDNSSDSPNGYAYATERLYSAFAWSHFFNGRGDVVRFDTSILKESCLMKLAEAEERYQYITLIFPGALQDTRRVIAEAREDYEQSDYALCLFKASKAKAEANSIINILGLDNERLESYLADKAEVTRQEIIREINKGIFPIIAYSYYQYANDLQTDDPFSSLLYYDYALEMSNFDWYLHRPEHVWGFSFDSEKIALFIIGLLAGAVLSVILTVKKFRPQKKR